MGSGSSKSRRRVSSFCSQQPLHPTEILKGESCVPGRVACEQKERDEGKTAKTTQRVLETKGSRPPPRDPDLQLLDDILTESEDCLSWQEPISKGQKMTNSLHTKSNPELLSQDQENQRQDKEVPIRITPEIQPVSSESEETQDRHQTMGDDCNRTAPGTRSVLDLENNNLPKSIYTDALRTIFADTVPYMRIRRG
ncbi:uncharacterized protein LOC142760701 isoform X2 [Rhinoderma darwinii]|uniref:uncharacterized protein LOC142760701 isoform X2 n=1 Tax=Rhinoderma darwinii TaxID=43563 RepID=UPI003F67AE82